MVSGLCWRDFVLYLKPTAAIAGAEGHFEATLKLSLPAIAKAPYDHPLSGMNRAVGSAGELAIDLSPNDTVIAPANCPGST